MFTDDVRKVRVTILMSCYGSLPQSLYAKTTIRQHRGKTAEPTKCHTINAGSFFTELNSRGYYLVHTNTSVNINQEKRRVSFLFVRNPKSGTTQRYQSLFRALTHNMFRMDMYPADEDGELRIYLKPLANVLTA